MPSCVGLSYGCHVVLATVPARDDAGSFMSLEGRYGLLIIAVVDHEYRTRYIHYGYASSSGDRRVQRVMGPLTEPGTHFWANGVHPGRLGDDSGKELCDHEL